MNDNLEHAISIMNRTEANRMMPYIPDKPKLTDNEILRLSEMFSTYTMADLRRIFPGRPYQN